MKSCQLAYFSRRFPAGVRARRVTAWAHAVIHRACPHQRAGPGIASWILRAWTFPPATQGDGERVSQATVGVILAYLFIGLIFGLVNAFVRPIVSFLSLPITILTLGLFTIVINAAMLYLTSWISSYTPVHFTIDSFFWTAVFAAIIISVVSARGQVRLPALEPLAAIRAAGGFPPGAGLWPRRTARFPRCRPGLAAQREPGSRRRTAGSHDGGQRRRRTRERGSPLAETARRRRRSCPAGARDPGRSPAERGHGQRVGERHGDPVPAVRIGQSVCPRYPVLPVFQVQAATPGSGPIPPTGDPAVSTNLSSYSARNCPVPAEVHRVDPALAVAHGHELIAGRGAGLLQGLPDRSACHCRAVAQRLGDTRGVKGVGALRRPVRAGFPG